MYAIFPQCFTHRFCCPSVPFVPDQQIYLGVERGGAIKRSTPQTLFLRAISHRQETYTMEGANQVRYPLQSSSVSIRS